MLAATQCEREATRRKSVDQQRSRRAAACWLLGVSLVAASALHVVLVVRHWPFPTPLAQHVIWDGSAPQFVITLSVFLFFQSLVLPFYTRTATPTALLRGFAHVIPWLFAAAVLYEFRWGPFVDHPIRIAGVVLFPVNVLVVYVRHKRRRDASAATSSFGPGLSTGWALILSLLAFNLTLIALPRIPFITSPPPVAMPQLTKHSFHFGYMDVNVGPGNPLFYIGRTVIRIFGRSYLTNHLLTMLLNVLAAVLFSVAVSRLLGVDLAIVTCAVVSTDRWFMKLAYIGNNAGTLLLPCAIAIACLTSITSGESARRVDPIKLGLRTGFFIAVLLCLVPYVYAAARPPIVLVMLLSVGWAIFRVRGSARIGLPGFALLLVLPSLLPSAVLLWSYDWNVARAASDFKANAYNPPAMKLGAKPESLGVGETFSPDLPIWIGFRAGFSPASNGSGERASVYWNRSPVELAQALGIHLGNSWSASRASFPGASYAEILFLAGLYLLAQAPIGSVRVLLLVTYMCLALLSPYLLVGSPSEFRRGAAVLLPFSLGVAVPLLMTAKWALGTWMTDQRRLSVASVAAAILAVGLFRYPLELAPLSQEGLEIGIQLDCAYFPIRELLLSPAVQQLSTAELMFVRQPGPNCIDAAVATIEVRRQLHNPSVIEVASRQELEQAIDRLQSHQYLILDCGASARRYGKQDELCQSTVVRERAAIVVPAPPHHSDAVWSIVK